MRIIEPDDVRSLLAATDPDAVLVVCGGDCTIRPAGRVSNPRDGVIIARRADLTAMLSETRTGSQAVERMAHCLDNAARDRCG